MAHWSTVCLVLTFAVTSEAANCYQCKGITDIKSCTQTVECPDTTSKCHAKKYLQDSEYKYDLGCQGNDVCDLISPPNDAPSQLASEPIDMWSSCCSGSYCNKDFDPENGQYYPPVEKRYTCYSCSGVRDPADCLQTTECAPGEVCLTRERIESSVQLFDLMCYKRSDCLMLGYYLPFGKRMTLCRGCCDERDGCNNQFCSKKLGLTNMNALGSSVFPVSAEPPTPAVTSVYDQYVLNVSPKTETKITGEEASIQCTLLPKDPSLTDLTLSWYLPGAKTPFHSDIVTDPEASLTVHSLLVNDSGTYTCEVSSPYHVWTASASLTVVTGLMQMSIINGPKDQTASVGDSVTFDCDVQAYPPAVISWQKMETDHASAITTGITKTSTGSRLEINPVKDNDEGIYRCLAKNNQETKAHLAKLTVEKNSAAKIERGPVSHRATSGQSTQLTCKVSGQPVPKVEWAFQSTSNSDRPEMPRGVKITYENSMSVVNINKMISAHVGQWTCMAKNSEGVDEAKAYLGITYTSIKD